MRNYRAALLSGCASTLLALALLTGCADQAGTSATTKTAEEQKTAYTYAEALVGPTFPGMGNFQQTFRDKFKERVALHQSDMHLNACLVKAGFIDYVGDALGKNYTPEIIKPRLATIWSQKYTVAQLTKVYQFYNLDAAKKMTQAIAAEPALSGDKNVMKTLYQRGVLSEADLKVLIVSMADPDVLAFEKGTKEDLVAVATDIQKTIDIQALSKKFLEDNAVALVNCAAPEGTS